MGSTLRQLVYSRRFTFIILALILLTAVVSGMETYYTARTAPEVARVLDALQDAILAVFVLELVLKLAADWPKPWNYFRDPWNVFDFIIIAVCLLPADTNYAVVLRLARVLRTLRMVTILPQLQRLVAALLRSIPSLGYVFSLLFLHFYIYAVLGTYLFRDNDPVQFGQLHRSMTTLFQVLTLEGWNDVFNIQRLGSATMYPEEFEREVGSNPGGEGAPLTAVIFFVSFILLGTMIILNLFTGVIVSNLEQVHEEVAKGTAKQSTSIHPVKGQAELPDTAELQQLVQQLREAADRLAAQCGEPVASD